MPRENCHSEHSEESYCIYVRLLYWNFQSGFDLLNFGFCNLEFYPSGHLHIHHFLGLKKLLTEKIFQVNNFSVVIDVF